VGNADGFDHPHRVQPVGAGFNAADLYDTHGRFGHSAVNLQSWSALGARFVDCARGRDRARAGCDAVFNSGKKAGKLAGSVRFGHLDL